MEIVLQVADAHKPVVEAMVKLLTQMDGKQFAPGVGVDYAAIEREIGEGVAEVERTAHQVMLASLDVDQARVLIEGQVYNRVGRWEGEYHTMAGTVRVPRTLYRVASDVSQPAVSGVDLRAGVVGDGWLPQTARAMAHQLQKGTSREAEQTSRETGRLPYSRSSFESVGHEVGLLYTQNELEVEQKLIEACPVPEEATGLSVSLDRVSVPMEEPRTPPPGPPSPDDPKKPITRAFRMAYCGTVTLHDKDGKGIYTIRYGRMPQGDVIGLCEGLASDVDELRKKNPDLTVTLLADGAEEMWNLMDEQLNRETLGAPVARLVDFWHTMEKLGHAAKVLFGRQADSEVARWKLMLLNDSSAASRILGILRTSGQEWVGVGESHPVHEAITYLDNHLDQMDYAAARRQGRPIGSGNVEATCKSLFEVRMKRSGARWKELTGEHVIRLRALALSDRWDAAMGLVLAPLRKDVLLAA